MKPQTMSALVAIALSTAVGVSDAQFMFRLGAMAGSGTHEWGQTTGIGIGIDELRQTHRHGWLSSSLNINVRQTQMSDGNRLAGLEVLSYRTAPPDTISFANDFSTTSITIGVRYEPAHPWLGYRQTAYRIVSPFLSLSAGYARFEHDQQLGGRGISGVIAAHGIPVNLTVGLLAGWGSPTERALDPRDASSRYLGVEFALDVTKTVWVRDRTIVSTRPGLTEDVTAPAWPTVMLRLMFMYRNLPLRST